MWSRTLVFVAAAAVAWVVVSSCSSETSTCSGAENCPCYGNGTCDPGLDCRSKVCVNLSSNGSGGDSTGGGVDVQACLDCAESACASASMDCKGVSGCDDIIRCMVGCGKDALCLSKCNADASVDANVKSLAYQGCAFAQCSSQCVYSGSSGSAGSGSGSGTGGGSGGSTGSGGAAGMAGGGGSGVVELTKGINWIGMMQDAAPPTLGPNGKLGINGVLYTYGDGCSTISWDPLTRCISGELCLASAANWGVSIGFDLFNTGDMGTPPNTKHPWSATAVGVIGFAWETRSALANSPQFWIQNMDPKYNGVCSAAVCGINGPPDGLRSAPQKGQVLFSSMMKDDWGGTGTPYVFNAANISALQFKLPAATNSSATSYQLCIDRLGVIR